MFQRVRDVSMAEASAGTSQENQNRRVTRLYEKREQYLTQQEQANGLFIYILTHWPLDGTRRVEAGENPQDVNVKKVVGWVQDATECVEEVSYFTNFIAFSYRSSLAKIWQQMQIC